MRTDHMPNVSDATKFLKDLTLGASAAIVAKTIIAPIERVKLILQVCLKLYLLSKTYNALGFIFSNICSNISGKILLWRILRHFTFETTV